MGIVSYLNSFLNLSIGSSSTNFDRFDVTSLIWVFPLVAVPSVTFIIFYNKKNQSQSDENKKEERSQNKDADYEEKYEEYIKKLKNESLHTDRKYKRLYSRIMNLMTHKRNSTPKGNKLYLLLKKYQKAVARSRIGLHKKAEQEYPQILDYINFNTKWMYKLFRRRTVYPVAKGDKKVDRKKLEEISISAFKAHQRRVPFNHIWPIATQWAYNPFEDEIKKFKIVQPYRKEFLFDVHTANFRDLFKESLMFNILIGINSKYHKATPPFYSKVIEKFLEKFTLPELLLYMSPFPIPLGIIGASLDPSNMYYHYKSSDRWQNIIHSLYMRTFPHSDKDQFTTHGPPNNRFANWPWLHQIHTIYSKNRVLYFRENISKQRLKHLFNNPSAKKKSLRPKIRFRIKNNRNTPHIWINYYFYRKENFKKLFKSLQLLYSKYPIYKSSTRHMSNQYLTLLTNAKDLMKKQIVKNKDHRLFETIGFFRGINLTRAVTQRKNKRKVPRPSKISLNTYRINKLRSSTLWKHDRIYKQRVLPRLTRWLIHKTSFLQLPTPLINLDLKMATFAITNPDQFEHFFKKDLMRLKSRKSSYLQFLFKDPYSIQKIGSDFFYYLGIYNPIYVKSLTGKEKLYYTGLERHKLGGSSDDPTSLNKKKKFTVRKKKQTYNLYNDYFSMKRYNAYNFFNSFLKSIILSTINKKDPINTTKEKPFFQFLYKLNSQAHLKTLYGFLFKSEYRRTYLKPQDTSTRNQIKRIMSPNRRFSVATRLRNREENIPTPPRKAGKYSVFKRYLKLKLLGALPKGVNNLSDWYRLVKSWEWTLRPSSNISSRYVYTAFHLIAFSLRTHVFPRYVRRGIKPYRYNEKIRITHAVKGQWKQNSKFLDPKRRMINRLSRTATRLNQTRYSLLNNQYLFMKELLQKHIKEPTVNYYKYMVAAFTSPLSNRLLSMPDQLLYMYNISVGKVLASTRQTSSHFLAGPTFKQAVDLVIDSFLQIVGFKPIYEKLLKPFIGSFISFFLQKLIKTYTLFTLASYLILSSIGSYRTNYWFLLTPIVTTIFRLYIYIKPFFLFLKEYFIIPIINYYRYHRMYTIVFIQRVSGEIALLNQGTFSNLRSVRTSTSVAMTALILFALKSLFVKTLLVPTYNAIRFTYIVCRGLCLMSIDLFKYLVVPQFRILAESPLLAIYLIICDIISLINFICISIWEMIYSPVAVYSSILLPYIKYEFVPIIKRLILFYYNILFTYFLFEVPSWVSPGVMSVHENRLLAAFYTMINNFRNREWRFILQYDFFQYLDYHKEVMFIYIDYIYEEYYGRWIHFMFRERRMFKRLYTAGLEYISSFFFGDIFFYRYSTLFRLLWLANMDQVVLGLFFFVVRTLFFTGAHILISPLYIGYALYRLYNLSTVVWDTSNNYTYSTFALYVHRQIVFYFGVIFGYPTYYIYNNLIYNVRYVSTIFAAFAMGLYNHLISLFVFSHTFINIFFMIRPVVFELAYETFFGGWPYRWIGGYRFAVTSEHEIFTATTIISLILLNGALAYFVSVELNRSIYNLMRAFIILSRKPSNPFKWVNFNFDLEYPNQLGGIQGMYLRYIYKTLHRMKYDFYNNRNIFWLFFNKPVQALVLFPNLGKALLSSYNSFASTHLRKYSDVLFNSSLLKSKVPLSTKWIQQIYPIIDPKRYDRLMKLNIPADRERFYWQWDDILTLAPRIKVKHFYFYPPSNIISTKDPIYKAYLNGQKNKGTSETKQSYEYLIKRLPLKLRKYFRPYNRIQEPAYQLLQRFYKLFFYIYTIPAICMFFFETYLRMIAHACWMVTFWPKIVYVVFRPIIDYTVETMLAVLMYLLKKTYLYDLLNLEFDIYLYKRIEKHLDGRDIYSSTSQLLLSIFDLLKYFTIEIRRDYWNFLTKCAKILVYIIIDLIQYPYICYYEILDILVLELEQGPNWLKEFREQYEFYCNKTRKKPSYLLIRNLYPIFVVPFKVFYQIFMFRVYNKGDYPRLDNRHIFESEINIPAKLIKSAPTHSAYYVYYDRNLKKREDFKQGKKYSYDYVTSAEELKNQ